MAKRIIRIVLEVLSLLVLLGTIVFLMIYWKHIPDQVPTNYDGAGQISGWSGKKALLMQPLLMVVLYVTLSLAKTVRYRSLGRQVRLPAPLLFFPAMKLAMLSGLSYMAVCTALCRPLGVWFLPVFMAAIFLPMIVLFAIMLPHLRQ